MVAVLVILDGASEPLRAGEPTSLELAATPALDRLAHEGELTRLVTIAPGLVAGSEAAIPALLGWTPSSAVDRGALEAAAHGVKLAEGERAWRVDVAAGSEGAPTIEAPDHVVHRLDDRRLLLVGRLPLPDAAFADGLRVWPDGIVPPMLLGVDTVVVAARGAALGAARLMGAQTIVPPGATGLPTSDLAAKASAAIRAIGDGAARVVVHVGGPDAAAHRRDRAAKVAAIERADRELVGPLVAALRRVDGSLTVCPDHGCDPATGRHDAAAVPCIHWWATGVPLRREPARVVAPRRRLSERAVAHLPERPVEALAGAHA